MTPSFIYGDRHHAGIRLGDYLLTRHFENPFILGLPRGGVVVAQVVARILNAQMDVVISRKIGAPGQEELGIGAISEDGVPYFLPYFSAYFDFHSSEVMATVKRELIELRRRIDLFRNGKALPPFKNHTVIVVDDGLATGVTAIAAGKFLRSLNPLKLILAVPLGPDEYPSELKKYYDEIVCPFLIPNMISVGTWYREFPQVEDEEVLWSLGKHPPTYSGGGL